MHADMTTTATHHGMLPPLLLPRPALEQVYVAAAARAGAARAAKVARASVVPSTSPQQRPPHHKGMEMEGDVDRATENGMRKRKGSTL